MLTRHERSERASIAALTRHNGADSPEVADKRREFKTERLADYIVKTVEAAPALSAAQRDRLALLLRGGDAAEAELATLSGGA